jgi:protein phosphatase PTC1
MIVRFDSKKVQETVQNKTDLIGVEGDAPTKTGGMTEAEHIVADAKKKLDETGGEPLDRVPTDVVEEQQQHEPGPELNPEALEAARKDKKPEPPAS